MCVRPVELRKGDGVERSLTTVAFVGLCMLAACSEDKPEACDLGQDTYRCKGNQLQWCLGGCFLGSCLAPAWATMETCKAPEVCRDRHES